MKSGRRRRRRRRRSERSQVGGRGKVLGAVGGIDFEDTAVDVQAVEVADGAACGLHVTVLAEAKASGLASLGMEGEPEGDHRTHLGELRYQLLFCGVERYVPHEHALGPVQPACR